jgi:hypothetical protein
MFPCRAGIHPLFGKELNRICVKVYRMHMHGPRIYSGAKGAIALFCKQLEVYSSTMKGADSRLASTASWLTCSCTHKTQIDWLEERANLRDLQWTQMGQKNKQQARVGKCHWLYTVASFLVPVMSLRAAIDRFKHFQHNSTCMWPCGTWISNWISDPRKCSLSN